MATRGYFIDDNLRRRTTSLDFTYQIIKLSNHLRRGRPFSASLPPFCWTTMSGWYFEFNMPGILSLSTGISAPGKMKVLACIPLFINRIPRPWTNNVPIIATCGVFDGYEYQAGMDSPLPLRKSSSAGCAEVRYAWRHLRGDTGASNNQIFEIFCGACKHVFHHSRIRRQIILNY